MSTVVCVANQKGGVGKTTTAGILGVLLARNGRRVHLVDLDPQADLTTAFGFHDPNGVLYEALSEHQPLPIAQLSETLSLSPSSLDLARGEANFLAEHGREFLLKEAIDKTDLPADAVVIIDCPPSLGVLSVNGFATSQKLVVCVHPGGFEMKALQLLQETIDEIRERINPEIEMMGVVMTMCDYRKKITAQAIEKVREQYDVLGIVRQDSQLQYQAGGGTLLTLTDSHGVEEYQGFVDELSSKLWRVKSQ